MFGSILLKKDLAGWSQRTRPDLPGGTRGGPAGARDRSLGDRVTVGFERSLVGAERLIIALEADIATTAPSAPRFEPPASPSRA
jgi:hypothetical protein